MKFHFIAFMLHLLYINAIAQLPQQNQEIQDVPVKKINIYADMAHPINVKTANAICKSINKDRKQNNILCETTDQNSENNTLQILKCDKKFYEIYNGGNKDHIIMPLYSSAITAIVKNTSTKKDIYDLATSNVKIGFEKEQTINIINSIFNKYAPNIKTNLSTTIINEEDFKMLCEEKVDAIILLISHPNKKITELNKMCRIKFLSIADNIITTLSRDDAFYLPATIKGGMYPGIPQNINTIGITFVLMANKNLDEQNLKKIKNSVTKNLNTLLNKHTQDQGTNNNICFSTK